MPSNKKRRTEIICEMTAEGWSAKDIAKELNLAYSIVTNARSRGRENGTLGQIPTGSPLSHGTTYYLRRGHIIDIVGNLSRDQLIWLVKEADKYGCKKMSEIILELVRDAHAEATKGQDDE